jgi:FdhD protein
MGRVTARRPVLRLDDGRTPPRRLERPDTLAVEEPLELRVGGEPLTVTMRTPGDDMDLAAGFLLAEGVIESAADLRTMRFCAGAGTDGANTYNVLDVALAEHVPAERVRPRAFLTSSACGVCGTASIDAVRVRVPDALAQQVRAAMPRLDPQLLASLPAALRAAQRVFDRTGGLHAAGLFRAADGVPLAVREDVGRHNAVDKVVGHTLREGMLPLLDAVLVVSGRASFELVQKALAAGVPALAAVSAPSSLAVDLAVDAGMTLVGFLRGETMNVYAGAHRLAPAPAPASAQA